MTHKINTRRLNQMCRALVEHSSDFIGIADADGCPIFLNKAGREMVGLTADQDISLTSIPDYYPESEHTLVNEVILPQMQEQGFWRGETRFRHWTNGTTIPVSDEHFVITDPGSDELIGFATITREISELFNTRESLKNAREQFDAAQKVAGIGSWTMTLEGQRMHCSRQALNVLSAQDRHSPADVDAYIEFVAPHDRARIRAAFHGLLEEGNTMAIEHRLVDASAGERFVALRAEIVSGIDRSPDEIIGVVQDITERRLNEARERKATAVFDAAIEAIIVISPDGRVLSVNRAFETITGFSSAEVVGLVAKPWTESDAQPGMMTDRWQEALVNGSWRGESRNIRKSGATYSAWETISAVFDAEGELEYFVSMFSDISALKEAQARLEHLAHHDVLTDLPNRLLFGSSLDQALRFARRHRRLAAVMMIDLDKFKYINDSLGHGAGDLVLLDAATRLRGAAREADTIARLGGDEFALVINDLRDAEDAARVAQKIINSFSHPFGIEGRMVQTSASVGISLFPGDGSDGQDLLRCADAAMYLAKENGRGRFEFFTRELDRRAHERLQLEHELRLALQKNELELFYQPLMDVKNERMIGVEALLRWNHPERGLLGPDQFISLAEESELIEEIGRFSINTALRQACAWNQRGMQLSRMAVNVSPRQFRAPYFANEVANALDFCRNDLGSTQLELEITENTVMSYEHSAATFDLLRDLGVNLAIDDFGTGHSSLGRIRQLPIDTLKVDRSFMQNVPEEEDNAAIVAAILSMSRQLGLTVVCEGVETPEQLMFLRDQGCDRAQGFLFSKPKPAHSFSHWQ